MSKRTGQKRGPKSLWTAQRTVSREQQHSCWHGQDGRQSDPSGSAPSSHLPGHLFTSTGFMIANSAVHAPHPGTLGVQELSSEARDFSVTPLNLSFIPGGPEETCCTSTQIRPCGNAVWTWILHFQPCGVRQIIKRLLKTARSQMGTCRVWLSRLYKVPYKVWVCSVIF